MAKPPYRTTLQRAANELDADIFRLANRAEGIAKLVPLAGPKFRAAAQRLDTVRSLVRDFMHEDDRKETAGG